MKLSAVIYFILGATVCVLGVALAMYGSTLPADIALFSRLNRVYEGTSNVTTLVGIGMLPIGADLILYGVFVWFKYRTMKKAPSPLTQVLPDSKSYRHSAKHSSGASRVV